MTMPKVSSDPFHKMQGDPFKAGFIRSRAESESEGLKADIN